MSSPFQVYGPPESGTVPEAAALILRIPLLMIVLPLLVCSFPFLYDLNSFIYCHVFLGFLCLAT